MQALFPEPLTASAFSPFGDVIESADNPYFMINEHTTRRYHQLATVQLAESDDSSILSIFRSEATQLPLRVVMMERHPKGSQAFIPMHERPFIILVADSASFPAPASLKAFISNGHQGVNYHKNTWHHPLICLNNNDEFLIVDRQGQGDNCDIHTFDNRLDIQLFRSK